MAEWSIAAVLKTVVLRGTGGSNPSLSAEWVTANNLARKRNAYGLFYFNLFIINHLRKIILY